MKHLMQQIHSHSSGATLVFPSEIAAEFWRRAAVRTGERAAIREDRLISWDTFKETAFELRQETLPANRTIRTVFAERFLKENSENPRLTELVPPEFASEAGAFAGSIESVLTRIPAALTALRGQGHGRLKRLRDDLDLLMVRYSSFLDEHGLFEPRWLQASRHFRGGEYTLVTPELADDYPEFQAALTGLPRVGAGPVPDRTLGVFPDSRTEMRWVLLSIARLLDNGTDPGDIFVTAGDLDALADRFRHEGEKHSVPLTIRSGRPLGDSAVGRFLRDIGEAVASGFAVGSMERLLLNCGVPWRDPQVNASVVISGIEEGAIGGTTEPDRRWKRLERDEHRLEEAALMKLLTKLLPKIARAQSFARLRSSFNEMLTRAIDRAKWSPSDERVLERTQELLRDLVTVEQDTGLTVENPYRFWMDRLGEQQYVPQQPASGVVVLPYRVGAATFPLHHFVVNATHAATAVVVRPFSFLSEADRETLGTEVADRDLSSIFLQVYSQSGAEVTFTSARETFEGAALPAGYFVSAGRTTDLRREEMARLRESDSYFAEESFAPNPVPSQLQVDGAAAYLNGVGLDGSDFTRDPVADPDIREIATRRLRAKDGSGLLRISASHVDAFRACPFAYLMRYGLSLEELTLESDPDDAAQLGQVYHEILAKFFDGLARDGIVFRAEDVPRLRERLGEVADAVYRRNRGMIPAIVYAAHREVFDRAADALLRHDAGLIDGHAPQLVEAWRQERETDDGYVLVGRLDRATEAPDGSLTLVDYKKTSLPSYKAINAGSDEALGENGNGPADRAAQTRTLGSVQIPLYIRLLEAGGKRVGAAGYYSLENAEYRSVVGDDPLVQGKPAMSRERLGEVMSLVDDLVAEMVARVRAGEFGCADECKGCPMRSVCRTRYHVR